MPGGKTKDREEVCTSKLGVGRIDFIFMSKLANVAMQEKTWQEKVSEKLPGRPTVQTSSQFGPAPNLIFGTLAASALLQVTYPADVIGFQVRKDQGKVGLAARE